MLVLTRKPGEKIVIGTSYEVEVVSVERGVVKFAFYVDKSITLMPGNVQIDVMPAGDGDIPPPIKVTRKVDDSVIFGDDEFSQIEVLVVSVKGEAVRVGVKAPREVQVHRQEVYEEIRRANIAAAQPGDIDPSQLRRLLADRTPKPGEETESTSNIEQPSDNGPKPPND